MILPRNDTTIGGTILLVSNAIKTQLKAPKKSHLLGYSYIIPKLPRLKKKKPRWMINMFVNGSWKLNKEIL